MPMLKILFDGEPIAFESLQKDRSNTFGLFAARHDEMEAVEKRRELALQKYVQGGRAGFELGIAEHARDAFHYRLLRVLGHGEMHGQFTQWRNFQFSHERRGFFRK